MRKLLLAMAVIAGAASMSEVANAAPLAGPIPLASQPAAVQTVQWRPGWRPGWRGRGWLPHHRWIEYHRWHRWDRYNRWHRY